MLTQRRRKPEPSVTVALPAVRPEKSLSANSTATYNDVILMNVHLSSTEGPGMSYDETAEVAIPIM